MNSLFDQIDLLFGQLNSLIANLIFIDILPGPINFPLAVAWLVVGALFFTLKLGFINLRGFRHAIAITLGKYDDPAHQGEVSHFQALTTALSATVGLGNIAGVAIAVGIGGPGATFWMIVAGLLGMSSKFTECTLAVMYRKVRPNGSFMGGPMEYLSQGFSEKGLPKLGRFLAIAFCLLCIGGSLGGGNAFQVNQSLNALKISIPFLSDNPWIYGLIMSALVGIVIIGGLGRIAKTTEKLVPFMCGLYLVAVLYILGSHFEQIPATFGLIFQGAFSPEAGYGGIIGVLITGFKRAAFSNEAGVGSAAIAHSAAKTNIPVREGFVSLLEPFIDTVVICTMTSLVIIITGAYNSPLTSDLIATNQGAALTSFAFGSVVSWFPYILSISVALFAYSTMISWSYYGERCWSYVFGDQHSMKYKIVFLIATFLGSVTSATNVMEFSDLMILSMAFPNMIGLYFLSGKVKRALVEYQKI